MKNSTAKFAILGSTVLWASISLVQAAPRERGAYVDAQIGFGPDASFYYDITRYLFLEEEDPRSVGINVNPNIGYQVNRYFALEVGYQYFYENAHSVDLAAKFILPFTLNNKDFSVYARLGPAFLIVPDENITTPFAVAGFGASYTLNKNLDLNIEAQVIFPSIRAGLSYHFG